MAHGPIFFAQFPDITCRKIQEICKIPNLPVYLQTLDRFSCSKSHLHFKMAFEKIGPLFIFANVMMASKFYKIKLFSYLILFFYLLVLTFLYINV